MATDEALRAHREDLVRRHMADENALDFDAVLATFPHPHYELIPTGAVYDGREAVSAYYADTRAAFPDQTNELISLRHAGDAVVVEFWLRGTHKGPFRAIPATGGRFEARMTAFFLFEGSTLVCERVYFDVLTILKQLFGAIDPKRPSSLLLVARAFWGLRKGLR